MSEKDEKIKQLEKINSNKTIELRELTETLKMVRFSSYEPSFLIYTEVTLKDEKIIRTSKLPIYNK